MSDKEMLDNEELNFDDAFAKAADGEEIENPEDNRPEDEVADPEDTGDKDSDEDVDETEGDEEELDAEENEDDDNSDEDGEDGEDWKSKFEQAQSQISQMKSRLVSESDEYKQLKAQVEEFRIQQEAMRLAQGQTSQPETQEEKDALEESEGFKYLKNEYPDIADAISEVLDAKLSATSSKVEERITKALAPVEAQFGNLMQESHEDRIKRAHPDVEDILKEGKLDEWQASLPYVAREGVKYVRNYGTADEVVEMLNQYKADTQPSKPEKTKTKKKKAPKSENPDAILDDAAFMQKLKAALFVPGSKSKPNLDARVGGEEPQDFDSAFDLAAKDG